MNDACWLFNLGRYHCLRNLNTSAGTIGAGSPLAWMLIGLLPVMIGTISLCLAIREVKVSSGIEMLKYRQLTQQAHIACALFFSFGCSGALDGK